MIALFPDLCLLVPLIERRPISNGNKQENLDQAISQEWATYFQKLPTSIEKDNIKTSDPIFWIRVKTNKNSSLLQVPSDLIIYNVPHTTRTDFSHVLS